MSRLLDGFAAAYRDVLPELVPDEPVLEAVLTAHTPGTEPEPPPGPDEKVLRGVMVVVVVLALLTEPPRLLDAAGWFARRLLQWLFLGCGARGDRTSTAARVRHLRREHEKLLLAVTPTSLYVIDAPDPFPARRRWRTRCRPDEQRPRLLCRLDRSEIRNARVTWYRLNPGRLVVHFTDGSWTSFADSGNMGRRRAKAFAAVLNHVVGPVPVAAGRPDAVTRGAPARSGRTSG